MGRAIALTPLIVAGFLLNGLVPFSLFLIIGIIYSIGATSQIIVLVAALVGGGFVFSATGLFAARFGVYAGIIILIGSVASAVFVYLFLNISMVLTLEELGIFSFINMSSNGLITYSISRLAEKTTGRLLSEVHFLSLGAGSLAVFFVLFFIYTYMEYSNLPLIALVSEIVVFLICLLLLRSAVLTGQRNEVGDA